MSASRVPEFQMEEEEKTGLDEIGKVVFDWTIEDFKKFDEFGFEIRYGVVH